MSGHRSPVDTHHKGPMTMGFGVSFDASPNKLLSEQIVELPVNLSVIRRHCNDLTWAFTSISKF